MFYESNLHATERLYLSLVVKPSQKYFYHASVWVMTHLVDGLLKENYAYYSLTLVPLKSWLETSTKPTLWLLVSSKKTATSAESLRNTT